MDWLLGFGIVLCAAIIYAAFNSLAGELKQAKETNRQLLHLVANCQCPKPEHLLQPPSLRERLWRWLSFGRDREQSHT